MSNFTAGPWRVGDAGRTVFGPKTDAPAPKRIAEMCRIPEYHANARLIAASPTMYAYIRKMALDGDRNAMAIIETINA